MLLILTWIPVKVLGRENLKDYDMQQGLIVAVNHSSLLDTFVLLAKLPFVFKFIAYGAGFRLPFIKVLYEGAGYVGAGLKGEKMVPHLVSLREVLKRKEKIAIYSRPSMKEGEVKFSEGAVWLSNEFQTPILPVAIKGASELLPMGKFLLGWGRVILSIGKPSYFSSPDALQKEVSRLYAEIS